MLAVAGCLTITSCSSDDDTKSNNNVSADLTGTYALTAVNAPTAQDYDGDGDTNTNLSLEGSCYNDSYISFHENGTYDQSYTYNKMGAAGLSLECTTEVSAGTYTRSGDAIQTTRTTGTGMLNATFNFNSSTKTLTRTENNGTYSGWNATSSLWANLTGNLGLTFTKYTDNDNDNGNSNNQEDNVDSSGRAELLGNFNLTSFLIGGSAQDLDHNGTSSNNLASESSCYADSKIVFNADGTYTETAKRSILGSVATLLDCSSATTTSGTWTRNGDNFITRQTSGNSNLVTKFTLDSSAKTISKSEDNVQYPTFSAVSSLFANLSGTVNYTFTKSGSSN